MFGLTIQPLNDELRAQLELGADAEGLVVTDVDELSSAYEKGVRAGDLITEAGQQKIASVEALEDRSRKPARPVANRSFSWCAAPASRASSRCRSKRTETCQPCQTERGTRIGCPFHVIGRRSGLRATARWSRGHMNWPRAVIRSSSASACPRAGDPTAFQYALSRPPRKSPNRRASFHKSPVRGADRRWRCGLRPRIAPGL